MLTTSALDTGEASYGRCLRRPERGSSRDEHGKQNQRPHDETTERIVHTPKYEDLHRHFSATKQGSPSHQ
ncbi:MAG TPA: hypothetical protein VGL05_22770, partial [Kribbella sp.]